MSTDQVWQKRCIKEANEKQQSRLLNLWHEPKNMQSETSGLSALSIADLTEADIRRISELRPLRWAALRAKNRGLTKAYSKELHALTKHHGYT